MKRSMITFLPPSLSVVGDELRAQAAAGRIVGRHEAGVGVAVDGRVEDHDRDAGRRRVLDVLLHRLRVERRERDAVDAQVDHVLDDLLLLGDLGFGERTFPFDRRRPVPWPLRSRPTSTVSQNSPPVLLGITARVSALSVRAPHRQRRHRGRALGFRFRRPTAATQGQGRHRQRTLPSKLERLAAYDRLSMQRNVAMTTQRMSENRQL